MNENKEITIINDLIYRMNDLKSKIYKIESLKSKLKTLEVQGVKGHRLLNVQTKLSVQEMLYEKGKVDIKRTIDNTSLNVDTSKKGYSGLGFLPFNH